MKYVQFLLFFLLFSAAAQAAVVTQPVEYQHEDAVLQGYLSYDDAINGKRPAVIVVHEWKGLNDYSKSRAEQLAALGYVGFAIDMYGKDVRPQSHEEAAKISGIYRSDRNLMRSRAKAALDYLKTQEHVDADRIAAIGYCFGGATVLEMARAGMGLQGVASFHGSLDTPLPAKKGDVKSRIMVFHGAQDPHIKWEALQTFKDEMTQAEADWQIVVLGDAVHSFTVPSAGNDPSKGAAYNQAADKRSWKMFVNFLEEIFAD